MKIKQESRQESEKTTAQWTTFKSLIFSERKCRDFNLPLCLIYVDFEKAFDSVEIDVILRSLKNQGIELPYIHLLKNIYTNCTSTVALNGNKTQFEIRKGVRQGDTISPKLLTSCLEEIFHSINWSGKGGQYRWRTPTPSEVR